MADIEQVLAEFGAILGRVAAVYAPVGYLDTQGTILCKLGKVDEGQQAFERAIAAQSELEEAFARRQRAFGEGKSLEM